MKSVIWAQRLSIGGAALLVGLGWGWIDHGWMAIASGGIVLGWGLWARTRKSWATLVWLVGGVGLLAASAALGSPWWLALPAQGSLLVGWDLLRLQHRVRMTGRVENEGAVLGLHLRRLALVTALGLGVGLAAMIIRFSLRLEWAVVLGLIFGLSLSGALRSIRQRDAWPD